MPTITLTLLSLVSRRSERYTTSEADRHEKLWPAYLVEESGELGEYEGLVCLGGQPEQRYELVDFGRRAVA